jgi:hypothetical protein
VNRLAEILLSEELKKAKPSLEMPLQEFGAREQEPQGSGDLGPDALVLFLTVRGFCHRICRKHLFVLYPKCKAEIKSISVRLTHLHKKPELTDVCCKDLMRHFIHSLCPRRIDGILKTGDGVIVNDL